MFGTESEPDDNDEKDEPEEKPHHGNSLVATDQSAITGELIPGHLISIAMLIRFPH